MPSSPMPPEVAGPPGYPPAERLDLVEDIHGHRVADPYRWLEDPDDPRTVAWSAAQDELWRAHAERLSGRGAFLARLRASTPGFVGPPVVRGDRVFLTRREPDQEHPVLYVREAGGTERALLDPMVIDPSGITTLDAWSPSKDGRLLAYQLSEGGDEESVLRVLDVATGEVVDGPIERVRYSPVAWSADGSAFYYARRLPPESVPAGEEPYHRRVWRHRLGTDAEDDVEVFGAGRDLRTYYDVRTSVDGRWLVVSASIGTEPRTDVYLADLEAGDPDAPVLRPVIEGVDAIAHVWVHPDGRLYVHTNLDAPRWRLAVTSPTRPGPDSWRDLLPEDPDGAVLDGVAVTDHVVVAARTRDVVAEVTRHDKMTGAPDGEIPLPGMGTVALVARPEGGDRVWLAYGDYLTPGVVLEHDVVTGETREWARAPGAPDLRGVAVHRAFVTSTDGVRVPAFVVARGEVPPAAPRPTILYGYGGFDIALSPAYSAGIAAWVEAGGVYVVANLRGGSEYGEAWHRAGMRERKQQVFDDFAAVAGWLVDEGWTTPDRLGISGGSNGGLLVGAALTQWPDRFRSVVCSAPLLDMVRYERFGLGATWSDEYGTAGDPTELGWLLGYSPYHRVRAGVAYPAVLFTVFESDTRVDPLHARKLCAALQWATSADPAERPILLRRETDVGHGQRSVSRTLELQADTAAFHAHHLGLAPPG